MTNPNINGFFDLHPKGILVLKPEYTVLPSSMFESLVPLLTDPDIRYIVIDPRVEYNNKGDGIVRHNIRLIQPWYRKNLKDKILSKKQLYKLVWMPKNKIMDNLMSGMSFWPEDWLLEMSICLDEL